MIETLIVSVGVFLICVAFLGISMLLGRKSQCMQRGTCGGTPIEVDGVKMTCGSCPNKDKPGHAVGSTNCSQNEADSSHR